MRAEGVSEQTNESEVEKRKDFLEWHVLSSDDDDVALSELPSWEDAESYIAEYDKPPWDESKVRYAICLSLYDWGHHHALLSARPIDGSPYFRSVNDALLWEERNVTAKLREMFGALAELDTQVLVTLPPEYYGAPIEFRMLTDDENKAAWRASKAFH